MSIRVMAIAPYKGLKDILREVALEYDDIDLTVEVANLEEADYIIKEYDGDKFDAIVSRGGTSSLLKIKAGIPVIDIPVSGYDILRVLTLVKDSKLKVGMVGFSNICHGTEEIAKLINTNIPVFIVNNPEDVARMLNKAADCGVQVIIGDVVAVNTAERMGFNTVLITSGRESVIEAFNKVEEVYNIINGNKNSIKTSTLKVYKPDKTFTHIIGSSPAIIKCIQKAKKYAKIDKNIWLSGEVGTGKSLFAKAIHSYPNDHSYIFYKLDCSTSNSKKIELELFNNGLANRLINNSLRGTLFLKHIDNIDMPLQKRLLEVMDEGDNIRVIASSLDTPNTLINKGIIYEKLYSSIGQLNLAIPSLKERLLDIEEIARFIIASLNCEYGKQIVGFHDEAIDYLMEMDWPGNIRELINVITEIYLISNGPFIQKAEAEELIESKSIKQLKQNQKAKLDISGTWDQIEKRILLYILKEENMNQSKAAERLGISRSTIWRKLSGVLHNETK